MAGSMFRQLRLAEIGDTIDLLRRHRVSGDLLEIGAGTGWQAKALADLEHALLDEMVKECSQSTQANHD